VNYEARTQTEPAEKKAKRKLKNYKLKHSRLLTCYSALLNLLAIHKQNGTVRPQDARQMVYKTPTERLEYLGAEFDSVRDKTRALLDCYNRFLESTSEPEEILIGNFLDREKSREYFRHGNELGDLVLDALNALGSGTPFLRLLDLKQANKKSDMGGVAGLA
jgi:hypothetical protein